MPTAHCDCQSHILSCPSLLSAVLCPYKINSSPLTTDRAKIQKQYAAIFFFVSAQLSSIQMYLQRRNRHLVKQEDAVVIAIHILGKLLGFTSERAWHRFVTGNLFTNSSFLERSRYNRRCRALRFAIKWIRHELAKRGQH
ncbi:Transposase, partial [Geobacillus sp. WSUCF1]